MTAPSEGRVAEIADLTPLQKRFLSRRQCAWCEHPLHKPGCSAIWARCTPETAAKRRAFALAAYKPRAHLQETRP